MKIQQLSKKFKKNESGRSMVEMLGVLAIIGVLSVGGISGYKMAMEKITTNEILQLVDKFWLGYLNEGENPNSSIYDTTHTNYFSAYSATQSEEYSKLFMNLYGLSNKCEVKNSGLCYESRYAWAVNPFDNSTSGTLMELVLVMPRTSCEPVLNYIAQNSDMMEKFSKILFGTVLGKSNMTPTGIADYCNNKAKTWPYVFKGHIALAISFHLPYEIEEEVVE